MLGPHPLHQPAVGIGLPHSWRGWGWVPEHLGHLSTGGSWCQGPPSTAEPLVCHAAPGHPQPHAQEAGLGRAREGPAVGGPPSPLVLLPPSLVPEERGGQLRAPGRFQRRPADGEYWSNTGEWGPPALQALGRAQGLSQSPVQHVLIEHLLHTGHCSRHLGYSSEPPKKPCSRRAGFLAGTDGKH